jgi:hypothetical protein
VEAEVARAAELIGTPFPQASQVAAARARVEEVEKQLQEVVRRPAEQTPEPALAGAEQEAER